MRGHVEMKMPALVRFACAALVAVSLAAAPLAGVASGQGGDADRGDGGTARAQETRPDRPFDWGWLDLIGLTGLLGLLPRKEGLTRHVRTDTAGHPVARP